MSMTNRSACWYEATFDWTTTERGIECRLECEDGEPAFVLTDVRVRDWPHTDGVCSVRVEWNSHEEPQTWDNPGHVDDSDHIARVVFDNGIRTRLSERDTFEVFDWVVSHASHAIESMTWKDMRDNEIANRR